MNHISWIFVHILILISMVAIWRAYQLVFDLLCDLPDLGRGIWIISVPKLSRVCIWRWVAMNVFKFGGILLYITRFFGASKMMVCSICFFLVMFHKDTNIANLGD